MKKLIAILLTIVLATSGMTVMAQTVTSEAGDPIVDFLDYEPAPDGTTNLGILQSGLPVTAAQEIKAKYDRSNFVSLANTGTSTSPSYYPFNITGNGSGLNGDENGIITWDWDFRVQSKMSTWRIRVHLDGAESADLFLFEPGKVKGIAVSNNSWYRLRMKINLKTRTFDSWVYSLNNATGALKELVGEPSLGNGFEGGIASADPGYTFSQLARVKVRPTTVGTGKPIAFDNFITYGGDINTAVMNVSEGGKAVVEGVDITSSSLGIKREVAVATAEELKFSVQPETGYILDSVTVGGVDKTSDFVNGNTVSAGLLTDNTAVAVNFKKEPHTVTVNVGANGAVKQGENVIANGGTVRVDDGADLILSLVPENGYEVAQVLADEVDITPATPNSNTVKIGNITKDMIVDVSFRERTEEEPTVSSGGTIISDNTYVPSGQAYPVFSALIYSTLDIGYGWNVQSVGVEITDAAGTPILLPVGMDTGITADGRFGVRVFGPGLAVGETYYMKPFVMVEKDGVAKPVYGEAKSFAVTEV